MGSTLILGASGMLGTDLKQYWEKTQHHTPNKTQQVLSPNRQELDVTDPTQLTQYLSTHRPSLILNAVAYTNVDRAEIEREAAEELNTRAPETLARLATETGAYLVHFSTDQVFDGTREAPWTEQDRVNPINFYAHSKFLGEQAVLNHPNTLVLRVQWLYGGRRDRFQVLRDKDIFTPFRDQYGAPTWTEDVARITWNLVKKQTHGLFHIAYDDHASWADVFDFVKEQWQLPVTLQPRATHEVDLPAKRPLNARLSNRKLKQALGVQSLGDWRTPLRYFLNRPKDEQFSH